MAWLGNWAEGGEMSREQLQHQSWVVEGPLAVQSESALGLIPLLLLVSVFHLKMEYNAVLCNVQDCCEGQMKGYQLEHLLDFQC